MRLTPSIADKLLAVLVTDDPGEGRIGEALRRWQRCPSAEVTADAVAVFRHELDRLPADAARGAA